MAWDLDGIDVTVEVAFASDPLATTPTWTDVSDYVRGIPQIFRGTTSEDSRPAPGRATVVFGNRDRRFDPDYGSSPYSPNVKPMKRIRITVTKGAFSEQVYTGFVTSWRNDWTVDDGVSVAQCIDSSWWWANEALPNSAYEYEVLSDSPDYYWTCQTVDDEKLTDLGSVGHDLAVTPTEEIEAVGEGIGASYEVIGLEQITTTDMNRPFGGEIGVSSIQAFSSEDPAQIPEAVEFWWRPGDDNGVSLKVCIGRNDGADVEYIGVSVSVLTGQYVMLYGHIADNLRAPLNVEQSAAGMVTSGVKHVVVYRSGSAVYLRVNGVPVGSVALEAGRGNTTFGSSLVSLTATDGTSFGHVAVYNTAPSTAVFDEHFRVGSLAFDARSYGETSGQRIARVLDNIGWSSSLRDLDDGITIQGRYLPAGMPAQQYLDYVVDSERGALFVNREGAIAFRDRVAMTGGLDKGYVLSDDGAAGAVQYAELRMDPATVDTIRNTVTVSYSTVGAITRRDATSITAYGPSQLFIDGPTIPRARVASALAAFELDQRKDPATRISEVRCYIRTNGASQITTQVEKLLDLELYDIVDVEITPLGVGSQVVKTAQVLGISHVIDVDQWYVTLYLSPAYDQSGWFVLGTSALDGSDVLLP